VGNWHYNIVISNAPGKVFVSFRYLHDQLDIRFARKFQLYVFTVCCNVVDVGDFFEVQIHWRVWIWSRDCTLLLKL